MGNLSKSIVYIRNTCEGCKNGNDVWMDPEVIKLADACELCAKMAQYRIETFVIYNNGEYLCSECYKQVSKHVKNKVEKRALCRTYCEYCGKALNWEDIRK